MNFTSDVKREIIARGIKGRAAERAALSAFVRTSGQLALKDGTPGFSIVTETENVAEFFTAMFEDAFREELSVAGASMDKMSGRDKLRLECPTGNSRTVLRDLGLLKREDSFSFGISRRLVADDESALAYVKGAFLGGGSCILPARDGGKTGYHLEFVFPEKRTAEDFCRLLGDMELLAKVVERSGTFVVYIKSKETISDFLAVLGTGNALKKFSELVERRDEANQSNRAANCFSGNADKTATAAVKQVLALRLLAERVGLDTLDPGLKEAAEARLDNPSLSLKELAETLGVSKSCLNHRMRRLAELSRGVRENGTDE